jgi:hypothetical protein
MFVVKMEDEVNIESLLEGNWEKCLIWFETHELPWTLSYVWHVSLFLQRFAN